MPQLLGVRRGITRSSVGRDFKAVVSRRDRSPTAIIAAFVARAITEVGSRPRVLMIIGGIMVP